MTNEHCEQVKQVIINRRTTKPQAMNGQHIDNALIREIISLADYAPNHGLTEPWRFIVFSPESKLIFCCGHAELYKANTTEEKFDAAKYDKLYSMGNMASHIVIVYMQRGKLEKIPLWEEEAAVAAAIQNILLGATAKGIASYWGSGGMARQPAFKTWLGMQPQDQVMGVLYFGYADKKTAYQRNIPLEEKMKWR